MYNNVTDINYEGELGDISIHYNHLENYSQLTIIVDVS